MNKKSQNGHEPTNSNMKKRGGKTPKHKSTQKADTTDKKKPVIPPSATSSETRKSSLAESEDSSTILYTIAPPKITLKFTNPQKNRKRTAVILDDSDEEPGVDKGKKKIMIKINKKDLAIDRWKGVLTGEGNSINIPF